MPTTDSNHQGSTLGLVSWVMAVAMFFAVAIKIGTKITVMRQIDFALDNIFALGALIFAAGQTGALTIALQQGLGSHLDSLTSSEIRKYQQANYAADIMYLSAICLAKLSVISFFFHSTAGRAPRMLCGAVGGLVALWWLTSTFGVAFQCSLPNPWMFLQNKCINRRGFWDYVGATDALTDLCIIALPFYSLSFLQLPPKVKNRIVAPFCIRILVVPATIARVVFLSSSLNSADPTFDSFRAVVTTIIQMDFSIIFACTPFSKFVMTGVQSGWMTSNLRVLAPTYGGRQGYSLNSLGRKSNKSSGVGSGNRKSPLRDFVATATTQISRNSLGGNEENRKGSPTESEQHIIRQTTEWAVDYDHTSTDSVRKG